MNSSRLKRAYDMIAMNSNKAPPEETRIAAKKFLCINTSVLSTQRACRLCRSYQHIVSAGMRTVMYIIMHVSAHPACSNVHDAHPL